MECVGRSQRSMVFADQCIDGCCISIAREGETLKSDWTTSLVNIVVSLANSASAIVFAPPNRSVSSANHDNPGLPVSYA